MSLPSNSSLPKPPPKAPPKGLPPAPGMPPAATPSPAAPAAPNSPFRTAAGLAAAFVRSASPAPAVAPAPAPMAAGIDSRALPPALQPMVEAITLYDALLTEENGYLRAADAEKVSGLLDRKMAATRLYQERLRTVLGDPQSTRSLSPEQRATMVTLVKGLEERAKENAILLKANMSAVEQLFEVINTAARKMRKQEVAYSKAGRICETYNTHGVSLAFNSTI